MTFRADGNSVVKVGEGGTATGVALAFDPNTAGQIAEALNKHMPGGSRAKTDPLTGETVERLDINDERALSEVIGKNQYVRIVGPYATAMMGTPDGRQIRPLAEGAQLPGDVSAGQARHLIDVGLAELVTAKATEAAPEDGEDGADAESATETRTDTGRTRPAGNAPRDQWAAYATAQGAPEEETRPVDDGGLGRDELRARYGT